MLLGWSKTKYSPIAVDFGADSLKLLQVTLTEPPQIVAAAAADLPEYARLDPASRSAFFGDTIRTLVRSEHFHGKRVICSLPAYQTLIQQLQIPKGESEDTQTQIGLHLRDRLNVDPSRMVIRWFPVGQIMRDGTAKQEVVCVAAAKEAVMGHLESVGKAKLQVTGMYSEPQAIIRAFAHLYRRADDKDRTTCFIDIGGATTKIVIAHGKELVFAKSVHAAGDHFTRHHAKKTGLAFSDARMKRMELCAANAAARAENSATADTTGTVQPSRRRTGGEAPIPGIAAVAIAVEAPPTPLTNPAPALTGQPSDDTGDTLECLIDEMQLSLRYHQTLFPGRNVEKLIFLGGESQHIETCQKIARALRVAAQLGDPLARLTRSATNGPPTGVDLRKPQPGWAVPLGLCLSEENL